jgi:hypothetical protein
MIRNHATKSEDSFGIFFLSFAMAAAEAGRPMLLASGGALAWAHAFILFTAISIFLLKFASEQIGPDFRRSYRALQFR